MKDTVVCRHVFQRVVEVVLRLSQVPFHNVGTDRHLIDRETAAFRKVTVLHQPKHVVLEVPLMKAIEEAHIAVEHWLQHHRL